jgi:hypothetical protein
MNTLFKSVAAAAVLSVAIAAPAEVRADALPKSMLGAWCIKGDGYGRTRPMLHQRKKAGSTWLGRRQFPHCFAAIGLKRLTQGRK